MVDLTPCVLPEMEIGTVGGRIGRNELNLIQIGRAALVALTHADPCRLLVVVAEGRVETRGNSGELPFPNEFPKSFTQEDGVLPAVPSKNFAPVPSTDDITGF
jgi:hypothetical protein